MRLSRFSPHPLVLALGAALALLAGCAGPKYTVDDGRAVNPVLLEQIADYTGQLEDYLGCGNAIRDPLLAALANGVVPSHTVTTELQDVAVIRHDAERARREFGYLRMWSIHPNQILPIIAALCRQAVEFCL